MGRWMDRKVSDNLSIQLAEFDLLKEAGSRHLLYKLYTQPLKKADIAC